MRANEYEDMYNLENSHWWFKSHRNLAIQLIKSLNISAPIILDVGTGTGANLAALSKLGKAFGIDVSEKALEYCRRRGLTNVTKASADKTGFQDKYFDIITCLNVLEHLNDPAAALKEMSRVLKDEGKLIITVPAFKLLWGRHDRVLGHLRRYARASLGSFLSGAGFRVERMGYFFCSTFLPLALFRMLGNIGVPRGKPHSDITVLPPRILNEPLKFLFKIELKISRKLKLPFGSTLFTVVSKNETD